MSEQKSTIKIGSLFSLLLGITALIVGIYEAGIGGLLAIPYCLIALLGSLLGIVPFVGPFLYYFIIKWMLDVIQKGIGISMPITTGILFYSFLVYSIVYCFITTLLCILLIQKKGA